MGKNLKMASESTNIAEPTNQNVSANSPGANDSPATVGNVEPVQDQRPRTLSEDSDEAEEAAGPSTAVQDETRGTLKIEKKI